MKEHRTEGRGVRSGVFELGCRLEGRGVPTLVVGSSIYYPRTFSPALRDHLRMAFVDHRGFAPANGPVGAEDFRLETVLADMELARSTLGLGRVVVMGHSGHGYMALEYAKRYPEHVSHVVMIATGPNHGPECAALTERRWEEAVCPERKARFARDMELLAGEVAADPDNRFITFCLRMRARTWREPAFDASGLWRGVQVHMEAFDHLWGETFRDLDVTRGLERLEAPVFLALGLFDHLVAPSSAWDPLRKRFRDLTVRVFEESGHTPQLEQAEAFDAELLGWLLRGVR